MGAVHVAEKNSGLQDSTCPASGRDLIENEGASDVGRLSETFYVNGFQKYRSPIARMIITQAAYRRKTAICFLILDLSKK